MKCLPSQVHDIRKTVMLLANSLHKAKGWNMSVALRWAWKMVRSEVVTNVAGVTFGRRQEAIERLLRYDMRRVVFTLRSEANQFDQNAVAVDVTVIGKGTVRIGYLPGAVAQLLAPAIDKGCCPVVYDWQVTGEQTHGLRLSVSLVPGLLTKAAGTPAAKLMGARIAIR